MTADCDWLKIIGLAFLVGAPLGMCVMAFIEQATRCENCCRNDLPDLCPDCLAEIGNEIRKERRDA
jgi:hypothetical protein